MAKTKFSTREIRETAEAPQDTPPEIKSPRDKVRTLAELAHIAGRLSGSGKTLVHAHGVFDLLHLGHVRHLEEARRLGDALVVTITADRHVNKGPGRPVFTAELRAEMLGALSCVDWVAINDAPDAVNVIELLHPSVYIKGEEYRQREDDVTGKINLERQTVEKYGGRLHFTDELVLSSSEIINRHVNTFEPAVRDHIRSLREDGGLGKILDLINQVSGYRVVLVGDAIIDDYQYVVPMAKSTKENMIATRWKNRELFAGGVIAAANHVASFVGEVDVITCLGDTSGFEELIRANLRPNVRLHVIRRSGAPTTTKTRFIDPGYMHKLFEVYSINDEPLPGDLEHALNALIGDLAPKADLVITTDFGHGLIGSSSVAALAQHARFLAVNTQTNSANFGYNLITRYSKADYICIDMPEARLAAMDRLSPVSDIAAQLSRRVDCPKIIVTQGKNGALTYERGGESRHLPAFAKTVVDTVGAGDAFLAVTSPLVAAGGDIHHIGFIGNVTGALKVEVVGHRRSIEKSALIKAITGLLK